LRRKNNPMLAALKANVERCRDIPAHHPSVLRKSATNITADGALTAW
jgi:hypothetical protein